MNLIVYESNGVTEETADEHRFRLLNIEENANIHLGQKCHQGYIHYNNCFFAHFAKNGKVMSMKKYTIITQKLQTQPFMPAFDALIIIIMLYASKIYSVAHNHALINNDYLSNILTSKGFTFQGSKNKDFQVGSSIDSFIIQKQSIALNCFIMKLDKQLFVCAAYRNGKLVQEKQVKFETDIPHIFAAIFETVRVKPEENLFRFDLQLEKLRLTCEKIQQKTANYQRFNQEIRVTPEYLNIKNVQKLAYEKLLADSKALLQHKAELQNINKQLIEVSNSIQGKKQLLDTSARSFESQHQYLSNVQERIEEQISLMKDNTTDLNASNINEVTFQNYLKNLTQIKQLQLKKKCLQN